MTEDGGATAVTGGDAAEVSGKTTSSFVKFGDRTRFTVELRPGETTIVSWKKLMKDAAKAEGSGASAVATASSATATATATAVADDVHPALDARIAPGQPDANEDAAGPHRFSAVIEKIERLYMGKDSDEEDLNDIPYDDPYDTEDSFIDDAELDEYFQVDKSKTKHDGYFVNRGTLEKLIEPSEPVNQHPKKRRRKEIVKGAGNSDDGQHSSKLIKTGKKGIGKSLSAEKGALPTSEGPSVKSSEETKFQNHQKEVNDHGDRIESMHKSHSLINRFEESEIVVQQKGKSAMRESIDLNLPDTKHSMQPMKTSAAHKKEGSSVKSKVNVLERAIRELEKMVAESRPSGPDVQDGDSSSQSIKRRLPREIKQKLAKVARLAHASNGEVSKQLLSRLMCSLGHFCQSRTLKRHMNVMVTTGLSAKREKDDKFQLIKKEVVEMVKTRVPSLMSKAAEQKNGMSCDLQASAPLEKVAKGQLFMDAILEDKICDLYDTFVDGLDEDVAPQVRKLYAELAELWPKGVMDNHGIKHAICRAKDRRRTLNEINKDQEKIKRKKMVTTNTDDNVQLGHNFLAQSQYLDTKVAIDLNSTLPTQHNRFPTSLGPTNTFTSSTKVPNLDQPIQNKVKGTHDNSLSDSRNVDGVGMGLKKKVKKKTETLAGEVHIRPEKLSAHHIDDLPKQHKQQPSVSQQGGALKSSSDGFRFEPMT